MIVSTPCVRPSSGVLTRFKGLVHGERSHPKGVDSSATTVGRVVGLILNRRAL